MFYPDLSRILWNIPLSVFSGFVASVIILFEKIVFTAIPYLVCVVKGYGENVKLKEMIKDERYSKISSPLYCFFGVITFFLFYILTSYILVFGEMRLYVFAFMLMGWLLSAKFILKYVELLLRILVFSIFGILAKIVRFISKCVVFNRKVKKAIDNEEEIL